LYCFRHKSWNVGADYHLQEQMAAIVKFQGIHSARSADESEYQKHKSVVTKILSLP
jgi:hypothetical protein